MEGILPSPAEAETEEEKFTMPPIDMVATGRNIMRLREATGLTVRDLQDIFGFATPQAIYKWQHGTAMPTIDNLVVLAAVLDVPMDEIIVIDGNIKVLRRDAAAGGAAGLHGLEGLAIGDAAADIVNDIAELGAHGHFHQTGVVDLPAFEDLWAAIQPW